MKDILVIGKFGQLSQYFCKELEESYTCLSSQDLDLRETKNIKRILDHNNPSSIINLSSYNDVDSAENSKDNHLINSYAIKEIAEYTKEANIPFIHISTDYVFSGTEENYSEDSEAKPINEYGRAKLMGENYIREISNQYLIIRTSWLYSSIKKRNNFFNKVYSLYLKREKQIKGVTDSFGSPTSAYSFAQTLINIIPKFLNDKDLSGTYHFSNIGNISRFEFIQEILRSLEEKYTLGIPKLEKVKNSDFFLTAERPLNTSLNCNKIKSTFDVDLIDWKEGIRKEIDQIELIN